MFATKHSRDFVDELFSAVSDLDIKNIAELIEKDTEKFLVYSTYAKSYISKISTTYGDYLDSCVYLNKFILSSYPKIILYKQGQPYNLRKDQVESGYKGALKMTLLEEIVHSTQDNLQNENKNAATNVNSINEELAKIILNLEVNAANSLYDYLQLQSVPDDFPIAKRANLFFMLNPDNFVVNVLGPDVMTYSHVEIDPKISEIVPELSDIYQRWLLPIQAHHAAFSTMEGIAEFAVQNILQDDDDFQNYLTTFMGIDFSSYKVRKNMGKELTEKVYLKFGKDAFRFLIEKPPSTTRAEGTRTLSKKGFIHRFKTYVMNEREISLVSEWNSFVSSENYNLIEKCLKLAQILEYPELDTSNEIEKIKELGINFRNRITESKNPTYVISLLNEFLFDVEEFQGDLDDYYNPKNNYLNYILEEKIRNTNYSVYTIHRDCKIRRFRSKDSRISKSCYCQIW